MSTQSKEIQIHKAATMDEKEFHAGIKLAVEGYDCHQLTKTPKWYGYQAGQEMRAVKSKWLTAMRDRNLPALMYEQTAEIKTDSQPAEPVLNLVSLDSMKPEAFLSGTNFRTKFDNPEMQLVLYNHGLKTGNESLVIFVSERNVWSACKKDNTIQMSSDRLGHHPNLQYFWQGILDSNVKLIVWRKLRHSAKAYECLPSFKNQPRYFLETQI